MIRYHVHYVKRGPKAGVTQKMCCRLADKRHRKDNKDACRAKFFIEADDTGKIRFVRENPVHNHAAVDVNSKRMKNL